MKKGSQKTSKGKKSERKGLLDLIENLEFSKAEKILKKHRPKAIPIVNIIEKIEKGLGEQEVLCLAFDLQNALIVIPYLLKPGKDLNRKIAYFLAYRHPALAIYLYREETQIDDVFIQFTKLLSRKSIITTIRLYTTMLDDMLGLLEKEIKKISGEIRGIIGSEELSYYVYSWGRYSISRFVDGFIRDSIKKKFKKVLDLIPKIDEIFGHITGIPHNKFINAKDELVIFLKKFLRLLEFEDEIDTIDRVYELLPNLFEHFAFLLEKNVIENLVKYVSDLAEKTIPVDRRGIHLEPSDKYMNTRIYDYDKTSKGCRSKLEGKTVIRFISVKDCDISPRRYYILETLKRIVSENPKHVEFIDSSNPLLAEILVSLPETMSQFLKERIVDLAKKVVYETYYSNKIRIIRIYYYDSWCSEYSYGQEITWGALYVPEFRLIKKLSFDDALEVLDFLAKKLDKLYPNSRVFIDALKNYDPKERRISFKSAKDIVLDVVSYLISFRRYDNRLTKFLMRTIEWFGEIPEIIDKYLELLSNHDNALEFSRLVRFRKNDVLNRFFGRGIVAIGPNNVFSDEKILSKVIDFLRVSSEKDFGLFVHIVSGLSEIDLSNVGSLGDFIRAIHPGISELLLFRHPDIDLEKKVLEYYLHCLKESYETASDCTFNRLAETIEKLISNFMPSEFDISMSDLAKLRKSEIKLVRDLAELFLRRALEEIAGKKVLISGNIASLRSLTNSWLWREYIREEKMSLDEWNKKKVELSKIGVAIEEIKI